MVTELAGVSAESRTTAFQRRLPAQHKSPTRLSARLPGLPAHRIRAADFTPSRTQRRIARVNADLLVREMPPRATAEQYQLFQPYQQARHGEGDMATMSFYTTAPWSRHPDRDLGGGIPPSLRHASLGGCLTDRLGDGLSAVYSFFETGMEARSLGTYAVLWLVQRAVELGLPHVYLGYWVAESRKMAYKTKFRPSEICGPGNGWRWASGRGKARKRFFFEKKEPKNFCYAGPWALSG